MTSSDSDGCEVTACQPVGPQFHDQIVAERPVFLWTIAAASFAMAAEGPVGNWDGAIDTGFPQEFAVTIKSQPSVNKEDFMEIDPPFSAIVTNVHASRPYRNPDPPVMT